MKLSLKWIGNDAQFIGQEIIGLELDFFFLNGYIILMVMSG